jgi:ribosomal-protein-serine acetyltransferase
MSAIKHPELLDIPSSINGLALNMRRYDEGDGKSMFAALDPARAALSTWLPWLHHHQSVEDTEAYCRRMHAEWLARKGFVFSLWDKSTGAYIGGAGIHSDIDWSVPKMSLGYFICPQYEGKGYGTQAAAAVLKFAFEHLHAERVSASCDTNNERSWRLMERIGMKREATMLKEARDHHGNLRNTFLYSLTRA